MSDFTPDQVRSLTDLADPDNRRSTVPRYSVKAIVGPYWTGEAITSDMHRFHADGLIHARRIFDALAGGAARVYLYDRGELIARYPRTHHQPGGWSPREGVAA